MKTSGLRWWRRRSSCPPSFANINWGRLWRRRMSLYWQRSSLDPRMVFKYLLRKGVCKVILGNFLLYLTCKGRRFIYIMFNEYYSYYIIHIYIHCVLCFIVISIYLEMKIVISLNVFNSRLDLRKNMFWMLYYIFLEVQVIHNLWAMY